MKYQILSPIGIALLLLATPGAVSAQGTPPHQQDKRMPDENDKPAGENKARSKLAAGQPQGALL